MQKNQHWDRCQVGIGTLIVFIAMVLVAAIAAGVLIETAGFLQSRADEAGEQSSQQVSDRVQVISETGSVASNSIEAIDLTVKKAPGSGDIDIDEATIHWIGPDGAEDITESSWSLTALSGSTSVLTAPSDVFVLTLDLDTSNYLSQLDPGETATIRVTTASAGQRRSLSLSPNPLPTNTRCRSEGDHTASES